MHRYEGTRGIELAKTHDRLGGVEVSDVIESVSDAVEAATDAAQAGEAGSGKMSFPNS